ncbi:MAG: sigma-70 family RNA polymerase sigma factor, partial [Opitutaceae bacterium]
MLGAADSSSTAIASSSSQSPQVVIVESGRILPQQLIAEFYTKNTVGFSRLRLPYCVNDMSEETQQLRCYAFENSEDDFTELVRSRVDFVYTCALRRVGGDNHLAEDVTQRVFSALAKNARSLVHRESLGGWLFTATRNISSDVVRSERRRRSRELEAQVMNETSTENLAAPDWERLRPLLDTALDGLRERDREAILLRFFEGKPYATVAAQLGIKENAAQMSVQRSLQKMQQLMERHGVSSTSAFVALALTNHATGAAPIGTAATIAGKALAGTASANAVSFLAFMSTKTTMGLAAAVLALSVGFAVYKMRPESSRESLAVAELGSRPTKVEASEAERTITV